MASAGLREEAGRQNSRARAGNIDERAIGWGGASLEGADHDAAPHPARGRR
ncbi:MAG: hypothetical protein OXG37_08355 [Actinomycetia bacterium]|nr:hypothetical protein [Actinomycetes bacterium]